MFRYYFHGVLVDSFFELGLPEYQGKVAPKSHLSILKETASMVQLGSPFWESPFLYADGKPQASLYRHGGDPLLYLPEVGFFCFRGNEIDVHPEEDAYIAPFLLGRVFALWLQLGGTHVLHGSCVAMDGEQAFGILGDSGAGKSTLGAALVASGKRLVTDDLIPLEFEHNQVRIQPGIPFSRMWPDTGKHFHLDFDTFEKVHPLAEKRKITEHAEQRRFTQGSRVLGGLLILERGKPDCEIDQVRLRGARALMELVRLSYRPGPVQALGLQGRVLKILAKTVELIPVYRLRYPTGMDRLNEVVSTLQAASIKQQAT